MTTWGYIKGSEKDFEGAPDWATLKCYCSHDGKPNDDVAYCEGIFKGALWKVGDNPDVQTMDYPDQWFTIAQRELVTSVNDDRLLASLNDLPLVNEKYPKRDMVNHPSHYTQGGIECIDAITAATVGKTGIEAVCVANVVKYLWRYEEKNGLEDVKKARWYLERLINEMEAE